MKQIFQRVLRKLFPCPPSSEQLMYRVHLFDELLLLMANKDRFRGKRILEIGPKDGLDSIRLASLNPSELVMIDLPEKHKGNIKWLSKIRCPHKYIEQNFMYMSKQEYHALDSFDLIWCTGILYHNPEQMRFLRKLYKMLNVGGHLVLESATLRSAGSLKNGCYVEIHYPETYRNTGTITHLPTANAIKAWLKMVGFQEIHDSLCYDEENKDLRDVRYACICIKNDDDEAGVYYAKSGLNPQYRFGDST